MNKKIIKKVILISAAIICLALAINAGRFMIAENISKDINFEEINNPANLYDRAQGNYVLYTKENGIETAPFFWGERLYLYSIKDDESYLMKIQTSPLSFGFHNDFFLAGDVIAFRQNDYEIIGDSEWLRINEGNSSSGFHYQYHSENANTIYKDGLYVLNAEYGNKTLDGISKVNLLKDEIKTVVRGIDDPEFYIYGDTLYYYIEKGDAYVLMGKSLIAGIVKEYPNGMPIATSPNGGIVIADFEEPDYKLGNIYVQKTNIFEKLATISLAKNPFETYLMMEERFQTKGEYLYYYAGGYNVNRIDYKTGEITQTIDFENEGIDANSAIISYCTDYIILELEDKDVKRLLIYDYKGNFVREKNI